MEATRRHVLIGGMSALAGSAVEASIVRGICGGRNGFLANNSGEDEEEMYKEMFLAMAQGLQDGNVVISSPDITYLRPHAFANMAWFKGGGKSPYRLYVDLPNCMQIGTGTLGSVFYHSNLMSVNLPSLVNMYGSNNFEEAKCEEISLPNLVSFANHTWMRCYDLKVLDLPSVTSKTGSFFVYECTSLEHVYLPKMTLTALGGKSYIAQQNCNHAAIFHLQDGDYDYQGNPV